MLWVLIAVPTTANHSSPGRDRPRAGEPEKWQVPRQSRLSGVRFPGGNSFQGGERSLSQSLPESIPQLSERTVLPPLPLELKQPSNVIPDRASASSVRWEQGDAVGHGAGILSAL